MYFSNPHCSHLVEFPCQQSTIGLGALYIHVGQVFGTVRYRREPDDFNALQVIFKTFSRDLFLRANQISHRLHVHRVTGEPEATEIPPVLDCREHRIVVVSHARSACGMVGVRDS